MSVRRSRVPALLAAALLAGAGPAGGACTGDCDDDKRVEIAELITMVVVALDNVHGCAIASTRRMSKDALSASGWRAGRCGP